MASYTATIVESLALTLRTPRSISAGFPAPQPLTPELHAAGRTVEGRVHFAGEHTSLKPAWIEGALESAVRVGLELTDSLGLA